MMSRPVTRLIRIVDDDPTLAASLAFMLEVAGCRVKSYPDAQHFLAYDDATQPGCVLLDVRMPKMSGLELQRVMAARKLRLPLVFLSAHGDIEMAMDCVKAGAVDFIVKPPRADKLLNAIERACGRDAALRALQAEARECAALWAAVTGPEEEAGALLAKGLSNKEIARLLGVGEDAVRSRRASLYAKLDVRNVAELAELLYARADLRARLSALGLTPEGE